MGFASVTNPATHTQLMYVPHTITNKGYSDCFYRSFSSLSLSVLFSFSVTLFLSLSHILSVVVVVVFAAEHLNIILGCSRYQIPSRSRTRNHTYRMACNKKKAANLNLESCQTSCSHIGAYLLQCCCFDQKVEQKKTHIHEPNKSTESFHKTCSKKMCWWSHLNSNGILSNFLMLHHTF